MEYEKDKVTVTLIQQTAYDQSNSCDGGDAQHGNARATAIDVCREVVRDPVAEHETRHQLQSGQCLRQRKLSEPEQDEQHQYRRAGVYHGQGRA